MIYQSRRHAPISTLVPCNFFLAGHPGENDSSPRIPVIHLGPVKTSRTTTVQLHQVGTCGSNRMPVGLMLDGKCVTCRGHSPHCVHTTAFKDPGQDAIPLPPSGQCCLQILLHTLWRVSVLAFHMLKRCMLCKHQCHLQMVHTDEQTNQLNFFMARCRQRHMKRCIEGT